MIIHLFFIHFLLMDSDKPHLSEKRPAPDSDWNERYSRQIRLDNVGIEGQAWICILCLLLEKDQ